MNYLEKLKDYCSSFPREMEKECLIQIKKLKKQGFTNEWIYRAIEHKEQSEWEKFGFGLLWVEHYQNQITNLLAAEHAQLADIDIENLSWDSLLNDEEEISSEIDIPKEQENFDIPQTRILKIKPTPIKDFKDCNRNYFKML